MTTFEGPLIFNLNPKYWAKGQGSIDTQLRKKSGDERGQGSSDSELAQVRGNQKEVSRPKLPRVIFCKWLHVLFVVSKLESWRDTSCESIQPCWGRMGTRVWHRLDLRGSFSFTRSKDARSLSQMKDGLISKIRQTPLVSSPVLLFNKKAALYMLMTEGFGHVHFVCLILGSSELGLPLLGRGSKQTNVSKYLLQKICSHCFFLFADLSKCWPPGSHRQVDAWSSP